MVLPQNELTCPTPNGNEPAEPEYENLQRYGRLTSREVENIDRMEFDWKKQMTRAGLGPKVLPFYFDSK